MGRLIPVLLAAACGQGGLDTAEPHTAPGTTTGATGGVPPGTTTTTTFVDPFGARYDCGGMDPADAAPLGGYVALTFDDGPNTTVTPQIIEILRRHEVPATFFYVGQSAADPAVDDVILDVIADPLFDVANHTWSHTDLLWLTTEEGKVEIDQNVDFLLDNYGVAPRFFRFPYGEATCPLVDHARAKGMHVTGWNIDTADWCYASGGGFCDAGAYWRVPDDRRDDMFLHTVEQILESDGGVVLFHDTTQFLVDELEPIIVELKAAGFTFAALDDPVAFPRLNQDRPYPLPWIGQACPVSNDPCWQVENFAWCEPTGAADPDAGVCVLPCAAAPCFSRDGGPPSACVDFGGDAVCLGLSDPLNGWCVGVAGTVEMPVNGTPMCVPSAWL